MSIPPWCATAEPQHTAAELWHAVADHGTLPVGSITPPEVDRGLTMECINFADASDENEDEWH